jgi:8-oxo-dGTP diphosphatase
MLCAASCRNEVELARAGDLGLDFVTLWPDSTRSFPARRHWEVFTRLCRHSPLPVYAQGASGAADIERVRESGGFGVVVDHAYEAKA